MPYRKHSNCISHWEIKHGGHNRAYSTVYVFIACIQEIDGLLTIDLTTSKKYIFVYCVFI